MERAVHPDLTKRVLMPGGRSGTGKIEHVSARRLVQYTRSGGGKKVPAEKRRTDVTVPDVFGHAACAKLVMHHWIAYLLLTKSGRQWRIVDVRWVLTPKAKRNRGIPADL